MPLYVYQCPSGHVQEHIRPVEIDWFFCAHCPDVAVRIAANRISVTSPEVDIRSKFRRFTEASEETNHAAERIEQSSGQPVQTPNYWHRALAQSRAMDARGESPKVHKEQLG